MQARREGLLEAHEEPPWKELPAMRMARQLQAVAQRFRRGRAARLVRQQDLGAGVGGGARQRGLGVAAMLRIKRARAEIRDARHHHRQARRVDDRMFVQQHAQAHPAKFGDPGRGA
ncbi:hypothetical protein D3C87_1598100 [compost metagenome]